MASPNKLYEAITQALVTHGDRIAKRAGNIADIGSLKPYLTEEDIAIERDLTRLITTTQPSHKVFAEEEHDTFATAEDVWAIDPISGTASFIAGIPHYGLVVTHLHRQKPVFACVYDPSVKELFTAHAGKGAFMNGKRLQTSVGNTKLIFNLALPKAGSPQAAAAWQKLTGYTLYRNANSFAVNYCWVACGRFDGFFAITKDAFPEYAGQLMLTEAGGRFTNGNGAAVDSTDRLFCGGNQAMYKQLIAICGRLP